MNTSRFSRLSLIVGLALGAVVTWTEIVPGSADEGIFRGSRTYKPMNASIGDCCLGVLAEAKCHDYDSDCTSNGVPCETSSWPTNGTVKCKSEDPTCNGDPDCLEYCDCKCVAS